MKKMITLGISFLVMALSACAALKPYEKEYLLSPLMDDSGLRSLSSDFGVTSFSAIERLATSAPGSGNATSCPTCGG